MSRNIFFDCKITTSAIPLLTIRTVSCHSLTFHHILLVSHTSIAYFSLRYFTAQGGRIFCITPTPICSNASRSLFIQLLRVCRVTPAASANSPLCIALYAIIILDRGRLARIVYWIAVVSPALFIGSRISLSAFFFFVYFWRIQSALSYAGVPVCGVHDAKFPTSRIISFLVRSCACEFCSQVAFLTLPVAPP